MQIVSFFSRFSLCFAVMLSLQACKDSAPPLPAAPEVTFVPVAHESVSVTAELPGRINPVRTAEVRARATGILLKRTFEEGANVQAGDVLFEIDPKPLEANLASAKAALARATASQRRTKAQAERYKALVAAKAVSQSEYDAAAAAFGQDEAEIQSAKAAVDLAALNLGYAKVTAPISGRIGKAFVTEGALVSATEATKLAVINQLDPVYFDFTQSSSELLELKRRLESGAVTGVAPGEARVSLELEDGSAYPTPGRLVFSDVSVDETTGMITLRAEFPNPDRTLLPGMFARGRLEQAVDAKAITVPQRTLTRTSGGGATVLLVNPENKTELRQVTVGAAVGDKWVITAGLAVGDRLVVEGSQKAPPGTAVSPVPVAATADPSVRAAYNPSSAPAK